MYLFYISYHFYTDILSFISLFQTCWTISTSLPDHTWPQGHSLPTPAQQPFIFYFFNEGVKRAGRCARPDPKPLVTNSPERPCAHTVRQLATCLEWEEPPPQLWKQDRKLQQSFLGDITITTPEKTAAPPRYPISWKDLGLVRVASPMTVTQEGVFVVLSTFAFNKIMPHVGAFETIQNTSTTRQKKKHSPCIWASAALGEGFAQNPDIKINSVILKVLKIHCWHKLTEMSNKRW